MRVSLNWLRDYIDITLPLKELAERLTMAGMEVKGIETVGRAWENIIVGQVVSVAPHPNADRLRLATVDLGAEHVTVVCGAPNLHAGDKVPFARLGAQLIDAHTGEWVELKPAKIRGVVSEGMACSEKELGISDRHEGLMVLPLEAPLGVPLANYLGDAILDLDVTPNRPDCLSVIGIGREVAALTGQQVHLSSSYYEERGLEIEQLIAVEIADADLCRRYCASLIDGIKIAPSPPWLQERLIACGMRPINNIVDVTNYVMLEYGQPLHAFDYRQIGGKKIIVRRARDGEKITTIDGVERVLQSDMLVIADSRLPVAVAGVMGGADSEVIDITTSILLESANFSHVSIRHTSTNLKLRSEASLRFEKGISPELTLPALKRATQLILELAGGKVAKGIIDVYPGRTSTKPILFPISEAKRLLGVELKREQIMELLTSLGFECRFPSAAEIEVIVPYWRVDVNRAADLVEEIARILGYDCIPLTMLSTQLPRQQANPSITFREKLRDLLVSCGFQEVISYSLTSGERLAKITPAIEHLSPLRVANPVSAEQEYLRPSLQPGLLATLSSNQKHDEGGIRLFEIGKVYSPKESDLPEERQMLVGVLSGPRVERGWLGEKGWLDFFDAKGVVETLLERAGIEADISADWEMEEALLHPGRVAQIVIGGDVVGVVGELHPKVAESFDLLPQPVALFELEVDKLSSRLGLKRYHSLPRFPESVRDMAIVVDAMVPAKKIQDIILSFPLVSQVSLFDLYIGKQIDGGKKSLAFRVVYQSPTRTLTEEEVGKEGKEILAKLSQEVGASLRG